MNYSIVRWLEISDTWSFTDDIKPDANNPQKSRTAPSFSIVKWNEELDTWEYNYELLNKPPIIKKINLSKINIWNGEKGAIDLYSEIENESGENIQYKILVNSKEVVLLTDFVPTPVQINENISIDKFDKKENLLELVVIDEVGLETYFSYIVNVENRDTFTFERMFDFKEDYITDENVKAVYGKGLALNGMGVGEVLVNIPTEGKSKIKNIKISGYGNQNKKSIIPFLTSNNQDGYEISVSSMWGSNYSGWKAFNGKNETDMDCWASSSATIPQWIKIKLPIGKTVNGYSITSRVASYNNPLKSWKFEGSYDGEEWVVLDEQKDVPMWNYNETREYEVTQNIGNYLYYKIYITSKYGSGNWIEIGELQLYNSIDIQEEITIDNEMIYTNDLGSGKLYESRILMEYFDITNIKVK